MYLDHRKNGNSLITINQMPLSDSEAVKNALIELNGFTKEYGLVLTTKQVNRLASAVHKALRDSDRIEIGAGIMPVLAAEFCTSVFVTAENYAPLLEELVYIFFAVKTAVCDRIADRELVRLLRDFFENKAMGNTPLSRERDIERVIKYVEMEIGSRQNVVGDAYDSDCYTDERA